MTKMLNIKALREKEAFLWNSSKTTDKIKSMVYTAFLIQPTKILKGGHTVDLDFSNPHHERMFFGAVFRHVENLKKEYPAKADLIDKTFSEARAIAIFDYRY